MADSKMKKVLLIDDDEMSHMLVRASLSGVLLESALSGEEGVQKAEKELFDLILIDYIMPTMDGFETFEQLGYGMNARTPCILLSANDGDDFEYQVRQAGFFDYIKKPVVRSQLVELCEMLIAGKIGEEIPSENNFCTEALINLEDEGSQHPLVDKKLGLSFCEEKSIYNTYCEVFLEEWSDKKDELQAFYSERNYDLYRSHVHGLKNNAMYIGCKELSEIARTLEVAARDEDIDIMKKLHTQCVNLISRVLKELSEI